MRCQAERRFVLVKCAILKRDGRWQAYLSVIIVISADGWNMKSVQETAFMLNLEKTSSPIYLRGKLFS